MSDPFNDRERAAESLFAHDEELRFLAKRHGLESLANWAAEEMSLEPADVLLYRQSLVDRYVAGTSEQRLAEAVGTDLERAGKPAMASHVGAVFEQAVADAATALRAQPQKRAAQQRDPRTEWEAHHPKPKPSWGWGL